MTWLSANVNSTPLNDVQSGQWLLFGVSWHSPHLRTDLERGEKQFIPALHDDEIICVWGLPGY